MAMSLNKIMLIGNVGADPRISSFEDKKCAQFSLATSFGRGDKESTDWHNIVVWSPTAEVVEQYVRRGSRIYVEGRLRTRSFQTQDGEMRYVTEVLANQLMLLDGKDSQGSGRAAVPAPAPEPTRTRQTQQRTSQPVASSRPVYTQNAPQAASHDDFGDGPGLDGGDDLPIGF